MKAFTATFLLILCQSSLALSMDSKSSISATGAMSSSSSSSIKPQKAVVIGGGPAGLAAALALSSEPHNYEVTVIEASSKDSTRTFDASKAYLYNINARGQKFTKKFQAVNEGVEKFGVEQVGMRFKSFTLVPGEAKTMLKPLVLPPGSNDISVNKTHWIPRHEMINVLQDVVKESNTAFKVNILHDHSFVSLKTNDSGTYLVVTCEGNGLKKTLNIEANLVIGADGISSKVREYLVKHPDSLKGWNYKPKNFKAVRKHSPSVGLRIKALQMNPKFEISDGDGSLVTTQSDYAYAIRSKFKGPKTYLSLGFLPMRNNDVVRPANFITRPNHELWKISDGASMQQYCKATFPRVNFDAVPSDEWERFAKSEGTKFPPCQYTPQIHLCSPDQNLGIVLIGDAIHAFPPDIGQGVNAAFEDVIALDAALKDSSSGEKRLGEAVADYGQERASEAKAIARLAQIGSPYQYKQPLRIDRFNRFLWVCNVSLRILLNKLTFGLIPKPAIMLMGDSTMKFTQVMQRANVGTAVLSGSVLIALFAIAKKLGFLLK